MRIKKYTKVRLLVNCCLLLFFLIGCGADRRSLYKDLLASLIYISDNKNIGSTNSDLTGSGSVSSSPADAASENSILANFIPENSILANSVPENSILANSIPENSIPENFIPENMGIKILTHNVFLLPKTLPGWGNWGQNERAQRIVSSNYIQTKTSLCSMKLLIQMQEKFSWTEFVQNIRIKPM